MQRRTLDSANLENQTEDLDSRVKKAERLIKQAKIELLERKRLLEELKNNTDIGNPYLHNLTIEGMNGEVKALELRIIQLNKELGLIREKNLKTKSIEKDFLQSSQKEQEKYPLR